MTLRLSVVNFAPSRNGFHFPNLFPAVPYEFKWWGIPITTGAANNGVCGGMIYTVVDLYQAGLLPPADTIAPASGPLFLYLCQRLIDSFDIPLAVAKYYYYMNPMQPRADQTINLGFFSLVRRGLSGVMIREEWPKIQKDISQNRLCPIGIILQNSWNPNDMGRNHQVLVYGYELNEEDLRLLIYDPNSPDDDGASIAIKLSDPAVPQAAVYSCSSHQIGEIFCFFRTRYRPNRKLNILQFRV